MSPAASALVRVPVGVVVERRKAASQWIDFTWCPIAVMHGKPAAAPWTVLSETGDATTYFAGATEIELFRSETTHYRDNLAMDVPALWIVMIPTEADPPYQLMVVTADPAEGEGLTASAANLVEAVPMPKSVREIVAAFVAEHHVERELFKRKRDRADPESLARRGYGDHDE